MERQCGTVFRLSVQIITTDGETPVYDTSPFGVRCSRDCHAALRAVHGTCLKPDERNALSTEVIENLCGQANIPLTNLANAVVDIEEFQMGTCQKTQCAANN